jgi:glycine/D-amino acid oxidase-like deaminating enzyme
MCTATYAVCLPPLLPCLQVILCSACSGHGFKLSPAIGSALADMLTSGACREFEQQLQQHKLSKERPGHEAVLSRFAAV